MNNQALSNLDVVKVRDLHNYKMLFANSGHKKSTLYFHGFPGPFETLPEGELRIADQLFDVINESHNFYYPLYTTKKTAFNFDDAARDGQAAYTYLRDERPEDPITLIGQSWGAVLALLLAQSINIERLILIVPFLFLPKGNSAEAMIADFSQKFPGLLDPTRIPELTKQIEFLAQNHNPAKLLQQVDADVTIIAAGEDELVPTKYLQALVQSSAKSNIKVITLDGQTHAVEDRQKLWETFREVFANQSSEFRQNPVLQDA